MHRFIIKQILFLSFLLPYCAFAEPDELTHLQLKRTAAQGLSIEGRLTQNAYRQEPYQAHYTEKVPYQGEEDYTVEVPYEAQETYTEQIPYQDQETYTEQIPYQEQETYYEDIPYTERVPYTDTEYYTEQEYKCHDVTENNRECHNERVCAPVPGEERCEMVTECGTNAHGEKICKDRKVCHREADSNQCRDIEKCENHPTTRQQCGYENVTKSRSVTKYRDETRYRQEQRTRTVTKYRSETRTRTVTKYRSETRTRTVTKYRTETRTRTVTKYRDEDRCCVTRYRDVFDHQWDVQVKIDFPAGTELVGQESELIDAEIGGSEQSPDVSIQPKSTIFGYKIQSKELVGRVVHYTLVQIPRYQQTDLTSKTISGLKLKLVSGQFQLEFDDKAQYPRITTSYAYAIQEKISGEIYQSQAMSNGQAHQILKIEPGHIDNAHDYTVTLKVIRSGSVIENSGVEFTQTAEYLFDRLNPNDYGANTVSLSKLTEASGNLLVSFQDKGTSDLIKSTYNLVISGTKDSAKVFDQTYGNEIIKSTGVATIQVPLKIFSDKQDYQMTLNVVRESKLLTKEIQFAKTQTYARMLDLASLKDEKQVEIQSVSSYSGMSRFQFSDMTAQSSLVETTYKITLECKGGFMGIATQTLASKMISRKQLADGVSGNVYAVTLEDLGVSKSDLRDHFNYGDSIQVRIEVTRESSKLSSKVKFTKYKTIEVQ